MEEGIILLVMLLLQAVAMFGAGYCFSESRWFSRLRRLTAKTSGMIEGIRPTLNYYKGKKEEEKETVEYLTAFQTLLIVRGRQDIISEILFSYDKSKQKTADGEKTKHCQGEKSVADDVPEGQAQESAKYSGATESKKSEHTKSS
jgi:hypothetical protein